MSNDPPEPFFIGPDDDSVIDHGQQNDGQQNFSGQNESRPINPAAPVDQGGNWTPQPQPFNQQVNQESTNNPNGIYYTNSVTGDYYPSISCWRCGLQYHPSMPNCVHCNATNRSFVQASNWQAQSDPATQDVADESALQARFAFKCFAVYLAIVILFSLILQLIGSDDLAFIQAATVVLEIVFSFLVLVAIWNSPRVPFLSIEPARNSIRIAAWIGGILSVPILIGINNWYHQMILDLADQPEIPDPAFDASMIFLVVSFCIQPAVFEELFCRQLCFNSFKLKMGTVGTIIVTSLMFGMMHVFVPISVPYLCLVGLVLGISRAVSGTVILPIIIHFLHNLFVVMAEKQ